MREIDKIDEKPWDITRAFIDLYERLAMESFCQNNVIVDYDGDVEPDCIISSSRDV